MNTKWLDKIKRPTADILRIFTGKFQGRQGELQQENNIGIGTEKIAEYCLYCKSKQSLGAEKGRKNWKLSSCISAKNATGLLLPSSAKESIIRST